uniref:Uncharacterized protein n=1 Tax=Arundo donax TaxID=35708 RepID=A0A0A9GDT1_ARUDO
MRRLARRPVPWCVRRRRWRLRHAPRPVEEKQPLAGGRGGGLGFEPVASDHGRDGGEGGRVDPRSVTTETA